MSIRPEFAERILNGEKQVEFRRRPLGRGATHMVIYATTPVCAVVGVAEIERVERASPASLWSTFRHVGGIGRAEFFEYFSGVAEGCAYVLGHVLWCSTPLALGTGGLPARAPQAFQYLGAHTLDGVLESCVKNGRRLSTSERRLANSVLKQTKPSLRSGFRS
jgi:predicted transcriptional regulator